MRCLNTLLGQLYKKRVIDQINGYLVHLMLLALTFVLISLKEKIRLLFNNENVTR